jgi:hypothetical protein
MKYVTASIVLVLHSLGIDLPGPQSCWNWIRTLLYCLVYYCLEYIQCVGFYMNDLAWPWTYILVDYSCIFKLFRRHLVSKWRIGYIQYTMNILLYVIMIRWKTFGWHRTQTILSLHRWMYCNEYTILTYTIGDISFLTDMLDIFNVSRWIFYCTLLYDSLGKYGG